MERVGIRRLKDRLSEFVTRVRAGEVIIITDRGTPVARLIPLADDGLDRLRLLAESLDNNWQGGKPQGYTAEEKVFLTVDKSLSRAVAEERDDAGLSR